MLSSDYSPEDVLLGRAYPKGNSNETAHPRGAVSWDFLHCILQRTVMEKCPFLALLGAEALGWTHRKPSPGSECRTACEECHQFTGIMDAGEVGTPGHLGRVPGREC